MDWFWGYLAAWQHAAVLADYSAWLHPQSLAAIAQAFAAIATLIFILWVELQARGRAFRDRQLKAISELNSLYSLVSDSLILIQGTLFQRFKAVEKDGLSEEFYTRVSAVFVEASQHLVEGFSHIKLGLEDARSAKNLADLREIEEAIAKFRQGVASDISQVTVLVGAAEMKSGHPL